MDINEARKKFRVGHRKKNTPEKKVISKVANYEYVERVESIGYVDYAKDVDRADIDIALTHKEWAAEALKQMYLLQTPEEQGSLHTKVYNKVGFNKHDAEILSSIAQWYTTKGWISTKQHEVVRKRLSKYYKQMWQLIAKGVLKKCPTD